MERHGWNREVLLRMAAQQAMSGGKSNAHEFDEGTCIVYNNGRDGTLALGGNVRANQPNT